MLKPHHVLDEIQRRRDSASEPIRFYWVALTAEDSGGDRDRFAAGLRESASGYPLVPVVLRVAGFTDSNSVMNDLAGVLERSKDDLLAPGMRELINRNGFLAVVLISRRDFELAITSSPLQLPEWFPMWPTELVNREDRQPDMDGERGPIGTGNSHGRHPAVALRAGPGALGAVAGCQRAGSPDCQRLA